MPDAVPLANATSSPSRSPSPTVDVAAAMGFTSFGTKPHLAKKRKTGDPDNESSGSNSLPLGVRREAIKMDGDDVSGVQHASASPSVSEYGQGQDHIGSRMLPTSREHGVLEVHGQHGNKSNTQLHDRAAGWSQGGKLQSGEWDWQALRRGVRDERGDVAYYDASFVEDAWAGLKNKV